MSAIADSHSADYRQESVSSLHGTLVQAYGIRTAAPLSPGRALGRVWGSDDL